LSRATVIGPAAFAEQKSPLEKRCEMREIVFDTETTGFEPSDGHRIVEVGCVELMDHLPTGRTLQFYLNPDRDVPIESQRVHGLSAEFLADKPRFAQVVEEFLEFLGDAPLVIHNASFDIKFINAELERVSRPRIPLSRTIDTIEIAKRKIPGARYSLDELCKRFGVDLSARSKHGALLDAQLTAEIYLELIGGRPTRFSSALMNLMSKLALWITNGASPRNSRNSSATWANSALSARNSADRPCTRWDSMGTSRSGFR
jgi:DNA polymerase-3 subunit epsilon